MSDEKVSGADAAAVESARSAEAVEVAPHVERAISELLELKLDVECDMRDALLSKSTPEIAEMRLKAYEDVIGLIDVRIEDLRRESSEPICGHCDQPEPIFYTTGDDVDLCESCFEALCDELR